MYAPCVRVYACMRVCVYVNVCVCVPSDPDSGLQYYYNCVTRLSQWHMPVSHLDALSRDAVRDCWVQLTDTDSGRRYYFRCVCVCVCVRACLIVLV